MAGDLLRVCVRCDEFAPKAVREAMGRLPDLSWMLGDAMLVASELVTNAVRHSLCTDEDFLSVSVSRGRSLRIAVLDPGSSGREAVPCGAQAELGGLGLRVVEGLSKSWGTARTVDGHEVWAELELPARGRSPVTASRRS